MPYIGDVGQMPGPEAQRQNDHEWRRTQESTVYACADVYLYDPAREAVFLADRIIEPQLGPWPIGGKAKFYKSPSESAASHVERDFGINLDPGIIYEIGETSTPFPIAGSQEGFDEIPRHTLNTVLFARLEPDQVAAINEKIASGDISAENSGGKWVSIDEIRDPDSPYPHAVKEEMRMLHDYKIGIDKAHKNAIQEDKLRTVGRVAHLDLLKSKYEKSHAKRLAKIRYTLSARPTRRIPHPQRSSIENDTIPFVDGEHFSLQDELIRKAGVYAVDAADWISDAIGYMEVGESSGGAKTSILKSWSDLEDLLALMLYEPVPEGGHRKLDNLVRTKVYGDYHRRKKLEELSLPPVDTPDNGMKQQAVLSGAHLLLHAMLNGGKPGKELFRYF